jgi:hypothetical protein
MVIATTKRGVLVAVPVTHVAVGRTAVTVTIRSGRTTIPAVAVATVTVTATVGRRAPGTVTVTVGRPTPGTVTVTVSRVAPGKVTGRPITVTGLGTGPVIRKLAGDGRWVRRNRADIAFGHVGHMIIEDGRAWGRRLDKVGRLGGSYISIVALGDGAGWIRRCRRSMHRKRWANREQAALHVDVR